VKGLFLFFLALIASSVAQAKDPFACMYSGNVPSKGIFTFEIWRAPDFDKDTSFRLCDLAGETFLLVKAKAGKSFKVRRIDLDAAQFTKFKGLYQDALGANFKDDTVGLDGSSWCLEASRMQYLKACFWSPGENTDARGVGSFLVLGTALWEFAQFGNSNGKLY